MKSWWRRGLVSKLCVGGRGFGEGGLTWVRASAKDWVADASSIAKSRNESERLNAALVSEVGLLRRARRRVVKVRMRSRCWSLVCERWERYLGGRMLVLGEVAAATGNWGDREDQDVPVHAH